MKNILKFIAIFCCMCLPVSEMLAQDGRGITVTGQVKDDTGEVLIGAAVLTGNHKRGTVTDGNGRYSLTIQASDTTLEFSYIGYKTQSVELDGRKVVDVRLTFDTSSTLNDVVVIGYGESRKQDLTGSVANVKMADIAETPVIGVDQALQGRIAGVDIMSTTGEPGSSTSIRIRGTRSIEASNEPLIVVDGVMDAVGSLGEINPDDIESISILKDASSTAIYGSRGANGVVMVTTKKGVTEKPVIRAKATFGISTIAKHLDLMNAEEFVRYINDYYSFGSKGVYLPDNSARKDIESYANDTDWIDAITRVAKYQNYQVSISGNTRSNNYYASLSYADEEGIILNTGDQRVTGRLNYSRKITDWLNFGVKLNLTYNKQDKNKAYIGGTNISNGAMYLNPLIGLMDTVNPLNEDGALINTPYASSTLETYYSDAWKNGITGEINITPVKGLLIKSQNTVNINHSHTYHFWPNSLPKRRPEQGSDAYKYEAEQFKFLSENTVTYKTSLSGGHKLDVMGGASFGAQNLTFTSVTAKGLIMDELMWNNLGGVSSKDNYNVNSGKTQISRMSVFGRLNYNYKGRYYVTATVRGDGSSNFAADRKWGFFPSTAFKWAVIKEPFMKKASWLNDLSLSISAGRSGNDSIAAYLSQQAYASTTDSYIFSGSQGVSYYPSRLDNPNLSWEKTDQLSLILESAFLKNRIALTLEGYFSRTSDLLLSVQTIASSGYTSRYQNLGLTSNRGVELTIKTRNIEMRNFGWTTAFTISRNRQMVDDIGTETYISKINSPISSLMMYGYKKGYPLNAIWGLIDGGCFHNQEEIDAQNAQPQWIIDAGGIPQLNPEYHKYVCYGSSNYPGMQRVRDINQDGSVGMDDVVYLGQSDPEFYGGLQNSFNIGQFKIGVYFTYSYCGVLYNYAELYMGGSNRSNQYRYMLDAWHPQHNPTSDTPRAGATQVMLPSSKFVHDASYIRLKDINLSYTFDLTRTSGKVVKDITLGVSANNLFLWSSYNGFDPDVSTTIDDSSLRRVDMNSYPTYRRVVFSLGVRF